MDLLAKICDQHGFTRGDFRRNGDKLDKGLRIYLDNDTLLRLDQRREEL
ncbi:MAG: hypothetical protein WB586_05730 [Chthoniobacterales bacterium]